LVELVHARRKETVSGRVTKLADTRFLCELGALALLGETLFGPLVRAAFGHTNDADAARAFRRRFARLLTESSQNPTGRTPARSP
jgi:hypothetical protein